MCTPLRWEKSRWILCRARRLPRTPDSFACGTLRGRGDWLVPGERRYPRSDEGHLDAFGNDLLFVRFGGQKGHSLPTRLTVIQREFVDVHANETIRLLK